MPTKKKITKKPSKKTPQLKKFTPVRRFWLLIVVLAICASGLSYQAATVHANDPSDIQLALRAERTRYTKVLNTVTTQVGQFEDAQTRSQLSVVGDQTVQQRLTMLRAEVIRSNIGAVQNGIKKLKSDLGIWQAALNQAIAKQTAEQAAAAAVATSATKAAAANTKVLPILMYHFTPTDFDSQMQYLMSHGYTTITMAQATAGLNNTGSLPAKPVVITFDDGYADQMNAFATLQKYQLKATFYIITGGETSKWCIGVDRRWDQGYSCGDFYLSWDQIAQLEASGLIEIGAHTVNHLYLAKQSAKIQNPEIIDNKITLEAHLGHPVLTFAYPYGSYTATTVNLVRAAGFTSAVTTLTGTVQSRSKLLTLYRIQNVKALP
jgi:peptidoglycan/xylan/chitin deacetylase (PgdA/CDA1 family)